MPDVPRWVIDASSRTILITAANTESAALVGRIEELLRHVRERDTPAQAAVEALLAELLFEKQRGGR